MCIQARVSIRTIRRSFVPGIFSLLPTIPPLCLSIHLSPLWDRVRSLKFKYRESFAKNNVVPCCIVGQVSMVENSWYSFATWPPPFHRIRLNFPAIIGQNRDDSSFLLHWASWERRSLADTRILDIEIGSRKFCFLTSRNCFDYCLVL